MADLKVKGLAELKRFMEDQLPVKIERNIARGAVRAGMNVVKPVAQANVHSVSGLLAAGLKIGTRARDGVVSASLRATGKHAHAAIWVEFGTAAHNIIARVKKALAIGGRVLRLVRHPGARPKPFMRPALDSQATPATVALGNYIKGRLTKEGLDAGYITVEGDQ